MDTPTSGSPRRRIRLIVGMAAAVLVAAVGLIVTAPASADPSAEAKANPKGVDVSHYQGTINWKKARKAGTQFAWIKATEGTSHIDSKFAQNYTNAYKAKVIRGAYHFARPGSSSGAKQATYFAKHGGAWSADNRTLPGALDLEAGCHG
ncbi:MAG: GH25 family lysozyme, partial [Stackebrandtia sp.]